jgi:hypothetical protein
MQTQLPDHSREDAVASPKVNGALDAIPRSVTLLPYVFYPRRFRKSESKDEKRGQKGFRAD